MHKVWFFIKKIIYSVFALFFLFSSYIFFDAYFSSSSDPEEVSENANNEEKKAPLLVRLITKKNLPVDPTLPENTNLKNELIDLIQKDFRQMWIRKELEKKYFNVYSISYINRHKKYNIPKEEFANFLSLNPKARFAIIVEIYPFANQENGFLVQFNWYNRKTKNKVWEINRTYNLEKDKKKPDQKTDRA